MFIYEHCKLRQLVEDDLETILKWRNSEHIRANMFSDHIITIEEHLSWYKNLLVYEQFNKYMIYEYSGIPTGLVYITQIDKFNNKCYWGFYIGEKDAPKGSGLAMGYLALEYIFEVLKIRKLCSKILAFNKASINYHKKLGFSMEGHLIEHVLKKGVYEDVIIMTLFQREWFNINESLVTKCFGGRKKYE